MLRTGRLDDSTWSVRIRGRVVDRYEALSSLWQEMSTVIDYLEELENLRGTDGYGGTTSRALWVAALMAYNRCFAGGRRKGAANLAAPPPPHLRSDHDLYVGLRNDRYAHLSQTGGFETRETGALVMARDGETTIEIISSGMDTIVYGAAALKELAEFYRDQFDRLGKEDAERIKAAVRGSAAAHRPTTVAIRIDG